MALLLLLKAFATRKTRFLLIVSVDVVTLCKFLMGYNLSRKPTASDLRNSERSTLHECTWLALRLCSAGKIRESQLSGTHKEQFWNPQKTKGIWRNDLLYRQRKASGNRWFVSLTTSTLFLKTLSCIAASAHLILSGPREHYKFMS